jgi:hypothetical protein
VVKVLCGQGRGVSRQVEAAVILKTLTILSLIDLLRAGWTISSETGKAILVDKTHD